MNYYSILKKYNTLPGNILDCEFNSLSAARVYIDLAKDDIIAKRNYYIVKTFDSSPWQQAYDFTNSIKNELKKNSKLVKEELNENHLKQFKNISIAFVNFDTMNLDMIRILYSYINVGGIINFHTSQNSSGVIKVLSELFSRKQITIEESTITLHKTKVNTLKKVSRTKSILS